LKLAKFSSVCPVLVLYGYRHSEEAIISMLSEISKVFSNFIVVDNNLRLSEMLHGMARPCIVIHNKNIGGLAGAYNSALRTIYHDLPAVKKVLFLDDDTKITADGVHSYVQRLLGEGTPEPAAAITGRYWDRNSQSYARYLHYSKWWYKRVSQAGGVAPVSFVINSMALWDVKALRDLGFFNEYLGVDHVDTEMCIRAQEAGMKLYAHLDLRFDHTIGDRLTYTIFGVTLNSGNHSPQRRYSIGRATAFLLRSRLFTCPSIGLLMFQRLAYEALGICVVEHNRLEKLTALIKGIVAGLILNNGNTR